MEIRPYDNNAKEHPDKQLRQLRDIVREVGWRQPVLVNQQGVIVVGHGRYATWERYKDILKPVWVIDDQGNTVHGAPEDIPLTPEQEKAYRLADNKLNESDWKMGLVVDELKLLPDEMLDFTGFGKDLILSSKQEDDDIPESVPVRTQRGDIWQLGEHRVMCGDATSKVDFEILMAGAKADMVFVDPPYNTGMKLKHDSTWLNHMFQDALSVEDYKELIEESFLRLVENTKQDSAFYVCIDWRNYGLIKEILEKNIKVSNAIIWDKMVHGLGSDYKFTYEIIVVGKIGSPKIENRFGEEYRDVWHIQRKIGRNKDHATAKPIELCERPIKHASNENEIVLDCFVGSGSTIIAAEKMGRICYAMDILPKYVDVCLRRWEDYTGNKAVKL